MANSVLIATGENACLTQDVEVVYKNVYQVCAVDKEGFPTYEKEVFTDNSQFGHYYCNNCEVTWAAEKDETEQDVWKKVKKHLG